ncbi:MAG TPA: acetamidase/formamidase family protein [Gaiellaceae bacterium]|nr:acetamidase/formamidase family protein [Gaiellaceae bacterium]
MRGWFSRDYEPVASVDPGGSVVFHALNAAWCWEREDEPARPEGAGHALAGPFEVRGAAAGRTLVVRVDEIVPRPWGVTWGNGERFDWTLDGEVWRLGRRAVRSAPFLGVVGMPPPEPGEHSTIPPRRFGGNVDCKELVAGTTLFLPIPVDGALLMAGDAHGAQGDGEVSGTAIECPLESATLTLEVDDLELRSPLARTADAWLAFGFDEDLDLAAEQALATMLDLMERELAAPRNECLALASVAVDLRVTQVVNRVKGVHAVLRDDAIR